MPGMRILVADDSEQDRYLLKRVFELNGFEVDTAANGTEALAIAGERKPDLVFSDIMMPVKDGFQFCRELKAQSRFENLPFIFYSAAFTSEEDRTFARNVGATRFLEKPQNPRALIEVVKEILHDRPGGAVPPVEHKTMEDGVFIRQYSNRLVRKLEEKVAELEETRTFLEAVLDSMTDGLVIIGADYRVVDANYAACTLLNLSKEEILGRTCHELFQGLERPCGPVTALCPYKDVFTDGQPRTLTYEHIIRCEGHTIEVTASPVRDRGQKVVLMVEILRDVTDRTKLEEELNRRIRELEDFYDAQVARELRTIELQKENERLKNRIRDLEGGG